MNTNIIKKIILVLVVATLLTIGLTGCGGVQIIISTTGTVVVTVDRPGIYDIYMDGVLQGKTDAYGQRTITKVPGDTYYFVADGWWDSPYYYYYYYGDRNQTTSNGIINHVIIPVSLKYY